MNMLNHNYMNCSISKGIEEGGRARMPWGSENFWEDFLLSEKTGRHTPHYTMGSSGGSPAVSRASWHCSSPACRPTQQLGRVG